MRDRVDGLAGIAYRVEHAVDGLTGGLNCACSYAVDGLTGTLNNTDFNIFLSYRGIAYSWVPPAA